MKGYLTGISLIALFVSFSVITYSQKESEQFTPIASWQKLASPGELSTSHRHLGDDCSACHTAIKGPSPVKCMACHATDERFLVWPELQFHLAVPDCRGCHQEHLGTGSIDTKMDHNLIADMSLKELLIYSSEIEQVLEQTPSDRVTELSTDQVDTLAGHSMASQAELRCVTCHLRRDVHRKMFGQQCRSCHNTQVWMISEYRHPSAASTVCSQCHRAPPCHFTPHFKKVCAKVAGQLNAVVSDCHSCHQLPSWNSIKGAGWYESH
jgi:hypothetical protein